MFVNETLVNKGLKAAKDPHGGDVRIALNEASFMTAHHVSEHWRLDCFVLYNDVDSFFQCYSILAAEPGPI